jgi:hypothetical protein
MADHSRKSDELDTTRTFHSSKASLDVVDQVSTLIVLELVLAIDVQAVHVLFNLFLHAVIPEVFDGTSGPTGKELGDVSPTVCWSVLLGLEDNAILFFGPWGLGYLWVKKIDPSLST